MFMSGCWAQQSLSAKHGFCRRSGGGFRPATCRSSHDCASQCSAGPFLAPGRKQRWKSLVWWSKFNKINRIFDGSWNKPVILFLTIQVICNLMTEAIFSGSGCSISTPQSGKNDIGATYWLHLFFFSTPRQKKWMCFQDGIDDVST